MEPALDHDDGRTLVALARAAIRDEVLRDGSLSRAFEELRVTAALEVHRAAFVTLRTVDPPGTRGELRGCIGTTHADAPLYRSVIRAAKDAATHDPRFPPLTAPEIARVRLEVSALTPQRAIAGPADIVPGRHGVSLERGPARAVFLPQVAVEQGWGTREMLEHLALKAGLAADAWKDARLRVFEAEVFEESEL